MGLPGVFNGCGVRRLPGLPAGAEMRALTATLWFLPLARFRRAHSLARVSWCVVILSTVREQGFQLIS
jgi:hypothetical protein